MDIPWPIPGDNLFGDDKYGFDAHCWNLDPFLANAYKDAGDAIIQAFLDSLGRPRSLLYPALFCYRQYFELKLKHMTSRFNYYINSVEPNYRICHDLEQLWCDMECAAGDLMGESLFDTAEDKERFQQTKTCVIELNKLDPRGVGFRYPEEVGPVTVEPNHLRRVMNEFDTYLSALFDYCTNGEG